MQDQLQRLEEAGDVDGAEELLREVQEMGVTDESDRTLIQELLDIMYASGADFTLTFCALGENAILKKKKGGGASISAI